MKKLYFLDEQEKKRILNLHTEATKQQYLVNKKILNENWPIIQKMIGLPRLAVGKFHGKPLTTFIQYEKHNPLVVTGLDNILKNVDVKTFKVDKQGQEGGFMTSQNYYYTIEMLANEIEKYFKPDKIPTDADIDKFTRQLPNIDIYQNGGLTNLSDVLNKELKQLRTNKWWETNKPKSDGIVKKTTEKISSMGRPALFMSGALIAYTTIATMHEALHKIGLVKTSSEQTSEDFLNAINTFCTTKFPKEEQYNKLAQSPLFAPEAAAFNEKIQRATSSEWGTDEDAIAAAISDLNSYTTFCLAMYSYKDLTISKKAPAILTDMSSYIGYKFVRLMNYHFAGGWSPTHWEFNYYRVYVTIPLESKFARWKGESSVDLGKAKIETEKEAKGSTDTKTTKPPIDNCEAPSGNGTIDCLIQKEPRWGHPNLACVLDTYKKDPKNNTYNIFIDTKTVNSNVNRQTKPMALVQLNNKYYFPNNTYEYLSDLGNMKDFACGANGEIIHK
jgi:hypothetical protein